MLDELKRVLEHIEETIDVDDIRRREQKLIKALKFEELSSPAGKVHYPVQYKRFSMEEIHESIEKMAYNEFVGIVDSIELSNGAIPMIRANYGVGILPSAFGLKNRIVDGNMPWVDPVGIEGAKKILEKGVPDFTDEMSQRVFDTYAYYNEILKDYPKTREGIMIYQPDYQGPFDVTDLIWGTDIFMDMYDEPELIHELIALVVNAYEVGMKKLQPYLKDKVDGFIGQWQTLFPGNILLRNDSAVNISGSMYNEFVRPYDDDLLERFGGGSMHFCGRADQWIFEMAKSDKILGTNFGHMAKVQFGQPYLDFLKSEYTDKKRPIVNYTLTKDELVDFDFNKYRTGITYAVSASSKEEAKRIIEENFSD